MRSEPLGEFHLFLIWSFDSEVFDSVIPERKKMDLIVQSVYTAGADKIIGTLDVVYGYGEVFYCAMAHMGFAAFVHLEHQIAELQKVYNRSVLRISRSMDYIETELGVKDKGFHHVLCRDANMGKTFCIVGYSQFIQPLFFNTLCDGDAAA